MHEILPLVAKTDFPALQRTCLDVLQINLGYKCNQSCVHCHVSAGPNRTEMMDKQTADLVLQVIERHRFKVLDLTGGAPELSPHFRELAEAARQLGVQVIDRCNLTVLFEPGQNDLAQFLAAHGIHIVASLPCYSSQRVDRQRGHGVFDKSITALQRLNELGYGRADTGLVLNLVYNPQGATLPPAQASLEAEYRHRLAADFGIEFNQLFVLANMPIQRFGSTLVSKGQFQSYLTLLKGAFVQGNLDTVMCRSMVNVDWQGYLYDCDFNQALHLPMRLNGAPRPHLRDLLSHNPHGEAIRVADHCYGCTAGQGSSCGGALRTP